MRWPGFGEQRRQRGVALGIARDALQVFRPVGDFYPDHQVAVLLYSPQFAAQRDQAQRFMVAYLRGLRDFDDAFARDRGRAEIVDILTRNTVVRDAALYAAMVPHRVDRNGQVNRESLANDLDWYAAQNASVTPAQLKTFTTKQGYEAVRDPDGFTVYVSAGAKIFIIAYAPGLQENAHFRSTLTMMVNSFTYRP